MKCGVNKKTNIDIAPSNTIKRKQNRPQKGEAGPPADIRAEAAAGMDYPIIRGCRLRREWRRNEF
jgi:hypothetical protein